MRSVVIFFTILFYCSSCESNFFTREYALHSDKPEIARYIITSLAYEASLQDSRYSFLQLLRTHIKTQPSDPYNGLYLYLIGTLYDSLGSTRLARDYFARSLYHIGYYQRVAYKNDALKKLIRDGSDNYKTLKILDDFAHTNASLSPSELDHLYGLLYDAVGQWDKAYTHYAQLFSDDKKDSALDALYIRLRKKNVNHASVYFDTHQELAKNITNTLVARNYARLPRIQGNPFFSRSWQIPIQDSNAWIPNFNLATVFARSNVSISSTYSPLSNDNNIYIKTQGWDRVYVWYLVLKKIAYPDTPLINGKWEWGGVIIGEDSNIDRD